MPSKDLDLEKRVNFLCDLLGCSPKTARDHIYAINKGYKSSYDKFESIFIKSGKYKTTGAYRNYLSRQKEYINRYEEVCKKLKKKGYASPYRQILELFTNLGMTKNEYELSKLKLKGFQTKYEYHLYRSANNMKKQEFIELQKLIKKHLRKMNKGQKWLSKEIGGGHSLIDHYVSGFCFPKKEKLDKILKVFDISYSRIHPAIKKKYETKGYSVKTQIK